MKEDDGNDKDKDFLFSYADAVKPILRKYSRMYN